MIATRNKAYAGLEPGTFGSNTLPSELGEEQRYSTSISNRNTKFLSFEENIFIVLDVKDKNVL